MQFREGMKMVVPILTALPPASSLHRPDGAHQNNPHVRAAVLDRKEPQHVAWAVERADGGRGFGFTGGHWHWNWGHPMQRKLVLNAIAWTAKVEVPAAGIETPRVTMELLEENSEETPPAARPRTRGTGALIGSRTGGRCGWPGPEPDPRPACGAARGVA